MISHITSEEWVARVEEIERRFRRHDREPPLTGGLSLDDAIAALRKLGYSSGDALQLLRRSRRGKRLV